MADTPRIYVACLAAYNGGRLHGEWIDVDQSADEIHEAIKQMLSQSPEPSAEEWAIHDHENFQGIEIGESASIETVVDIAALLREHDGVGAIAYNHFSDLDEARKALAEQYYGEWSSLADWAEDYLKDTGGLENVPESLRGYIDFERWARDQEMGGDIFSVEAGGKVHIFSNH
jgi:antirestriction protein